MHVFKHLNLPVRYTWAYDTAFFGERRELLPETITKFFRDYQRQLRLEEQRDFRQTGMLRHFKPK